MPVLSTYQHLPVHRGTPSASLCIPNPCLAHVGGRMTACPRLVSKDACPRAASIPTHAAMPMRGGGPLDRPFDTCDSHSWPNLAAASRRGVIPSSVMVRTAPITTTTTPLQVMEGVKYRFIVPEFVTSFGQELVVVGSIPELGSWEVVKAPKMLWEEGHRWVLEAVLPKQTFEFKVVVTDGGHNERWEQASNRVIEVAEEQDLLMPADIFVQVSCCFDYTTETSMDLVVPYSALRTATEMTKASLELLEARKNKLKQEERSQQLPWNSWNKSKSEGPKLVILEDLEESISRLEEAIMAQMSSLDTMAALFDGFEGNDDEPIVFPVSRVEVPAMLISPAAMVTARGRTLIASLPQDSSAGEVAERVVKHVLKPVGRTERPLLPASVTIGTLVMELIGQLQEFYQSYPDVKIYGTKVPQNELKTLLKEARDASEKAQQVYTGYESTADYDDIVELLTLVNYGEAYVERRQEMDAEEKPAGGLGSFFKMFGGYNNNADHSKKGDNTNEKATANGVDNTKEGGSQPKRGFFGLFGN